MGKSFRPEFLRKSFKIRILFFLLLVSTTALSQRNAMKIGVLGAAVGDFSLSIEQVIHTNHTMNVTFGFWDFRAGLFDIHKAFNEGQNVWFLGDGNVWHGTVEMRNYFGLGKNKEMMRFYWGPYFRYWNSNVLLNDYIQNDQVYDQQLFDVDTRFSGIGVGIQLGYHILLTERLWLDFYFMGVGIERVKLDAEYRAVGVDEFDYTSIERDVNEAFSSQARFIKNSVDIRTSNQALFIDMPLTVPTIRFGINVAYTLD